MALNNFLISFLLHLGLLLPVTADRHEYTVAGKPITLHCPDVKPTADQGTVYWKHNRIPIVKFIKGEPWKVERDSSKYKGVKNKNFSLEMAEAEEGLYTCDGSGIDKNVHLHILKVTGSPERYLLQGESLELQLHAPNREKIMIAWSGPHNQKGHQPRWNLKDNNWRLQIKDLQIQDSGTWQCSVQGQMIPYEVTIIGFLKPLEEKIFAAVNSTVMLSYELNFNPKDEKYINSIEVHQTQETLGKPTSPNSNGSCSSRNISEVQFEDAGWYRCHLNANRQSLIKTIHLVVMKVFAHPSGHLLKKGEMNLCCNISSSLPPGARLRWGAVNESIGTTHCLLIRTAGLWTCSLIVEEEVKISMNYTVGEEAMGQLQFPLINVTVGVCLPLVLLILISGCLFAYITIKRKKLRVERMAQAKQHLLAKRTCQCQRKKSNDYHHT